MSNLETYSKFRAEMASGDVLEWCTNGAIGAMIRWKTGYDVNHTSAIVRMKVADLDDSCSDCLIDRVQTIEANNKGVQFRHMSYLLNKYKGTVYWMKLRPEYEFARSDIASFLVNETGKGINYDFKSLMQNLTGRVTLDGRNWFCSEVVQAALIRSGILKPLKNNKAMRPGEFEKTNLFLQRIKIFDNF
jgi:hypothetical protein